MIQEKQQYPTLNCTKISKAKTTSFKLYEEKDSSSVSSQIYKENNGLKSKQQGFIKTSTNHNFSYLNSSKDDLEQQESYKDIMKETKRILDMKNKIEDEIKKREESKKILKAKKKSEKGKKQTKKDKKKLKIGNLKEEDQDIVLSELDMQRFSTEMGPIKRLIEKIDWLKNLGEKCNIISPLLFQIDQQSAANEGQFHNEEKLMIHKNGEMLIKISELELEIDLMKRNLFQEREEKDLLSVFEIAQLARLEISSKANNDGRNLLDSFPFLQKYSNRENLQLYADELQIELQHMERTEFQEFNQEKSHQI